MALVAATAMGMATAFGVTACGEDRGGVEVQGGGTDTAAGGTDTATTPTSVETTGTTTTP